MGKRISIRMAALLTVLGLVMTMPVSAATIKQPYLAEQTEGKAPNLKVYMTGSRMDKSVSVSGTIGGKEFSQKGDIVSFQKSGEGVHYIVLLDNSGSIDLKQFNASKKQLIAMSKALGKKDKLTLYSVGTNSAGGEKTTVLNELKGSKKNKGKIASRKIKKIKYMNTSKSKTVLYRSLNQVLAAQAAPDMRTVVVLITDGEDDSKGKDINKKSTVAEVKNAMVPVYGILLHNVSRKPNKAKMSYTMNKILAEKNCRGFYYDCSTNSSTAKVAKAFKTIKKIVEKETYVVNLSTDTNKIAGKTKLKLTVDNKGIDPVNVDYSDYEKDEEAPVIVGSVSKISSNSISFSLQDVNGVNVEDANDKSHYTVQTKTKEGDGKIWTVADVSAKSDGEELEVTLTLNEDLYTAEYILGCSDIRDNSQDENSMTDVNQEFSVKDGLNQKSVKAKETVKSYWWIGLILLVIIIGIILAVIIKKKPGKIVEVNPDDLVKADSKMIRLTITDRSGAIKDVEWNVEGSLFVGRSEICNIYFDDDRLSKQHFVIEVTKMGCYIEDLESTNGTFVNGVKMTNRRMLLDEDVITAGREKIVFHIPKNQPIIDPNEDDAV